MQSMNVQCTSTHFGLVGEFHETFDHPQQHEPYLSCFDDEPDLIIFRMNLIREELKELIDAFEQKNIVEIFDALCDLSYVTNGAGQCLGINLDTVLKKSGYPIKTENKDYKVPSDLFETLYDEISYGIKNLSDKVDMFCVYAEGQMHFELQLPRKANLCRDEGTFNLMQMQIFDTLSIKLVEILIAVYDLGYMMGGNMDLMFREVHRSNMTKVCTNLSDAVESVKRYKTEGRYAEPSIRKKGKYYVVYDAKTTKILKNYKWEQPNLTQFF